MTEIYRMKSLLTVMLLCLSFACTEAIAHGGRTNSSGCHNNRKTGDYHCHNGGSSTKKSSASYLLSKSKATKNCSTANCSEIPSCEIAVYKFTQCGQRSLDGDGDGVPCESMCSRSSVLRFAGVSSKNPTAKPLGESAKGTISRKQDSTRSAQLILNDLGFSVGSADGIYGKNTKQAIQQFQTKYGLVSDGKVSTELVSKLEQTRSGQLLEEKLQNSIAEGEKMLSELSVKVPIAKSVTVAEPTLHQKQTAYSSGDNPKGSDAPWWAWVLGTLIVVNFFSKKRR